MHEQAPPEFPHCNLRATFDRVIEVNADGILVVGTDQTICYCNPAAERIFGRSREELLGSPFGLPVIQDDFAEISVRCGDGRTVITEMRAAPTHWGNREAFVITLRDVTERRRMEEELRQAHKMQALGALAGGIAHDFNNLLTSILSYSALLLDGINPEDPRYRYAAKIRSVAHRAAALTGQLLTFSQRRVVQPRVLDLNEVVSESASLLRHMVGEQARFEFELSPTPAMVRIDRAQIEQVLLNLTVNARDAMPAGGVLRCTVGVVPTSEKRNMFESGVSAPGQVILTISDTGCGMDAETQRRAFEPFFTTKPEGKGTGLGLAIVYGIITQASGQISLMSELSAGTTIQIALPLVRAASEPVPQPAAEPTARPENAARVLLVEDDEEIREITAELLTGQGYEVEAATNGSEALGILKSASAPYDLVVTDLVMPVMGGRELAEQARQQWPTLPFLFMSGYPKHTLPDAIQTGGRSEFLGKPFSPPALLDKVSNLLSTADTAPLPRVGGWSDCVNTVSGI